MPNRSSRADVSNTVKAISVIICPILAFVVGLDVQRYVMALICANAHKRKRPIYIYYIIYNVLLILCASVQVFFLVVRARSFLFFCSITPENG